MDLRGNTDYSIPRRKSIYSVGGENDKRIGTGCAVKKNGKYRLLTWCKPGESAHPTTVNRYCSQYPKHERKHKHRYTATELGNRNGLMSVSVQLLSEPQPFLEMATVGQDREKSSAYTFEGKEIIKFSAYTFQGKKIIKLKFKRNKEGQYELKNKPKEKTDSEFTTGAPIIIKQHTQEKGRVVGVLNEDLSPAFLSEADIGK